MGKTKNKTNQDSDLLSYELVSRGYACKDNWEKRAKAIQRRYAEIKGDLDKIARIDTEHKRGRNTIVYKNHKQLIKKYSVVDLLIYADDGNLCYGGSVDGNRYTYFTD
jgi:tRNA/tmRNA/rRNA uracil-C5-methylase (TrmA/RlmC/RlmD family)